MNWYYCCKDGKTVIGPLPVEAIDALRRCGTIDDETPIVAEGSTDWKTFGETFKKGSSHVRDDAPYLDRSRPDRRMETIPASVARVAGSIDFGGILKWVGSRKKAVGIVIASLLLVPALGSKIRSKIEREWAAQEFRKTVMENRASGSSRSSSHRYDPPAAATNKDKKDYRLCPDCKGKGEGEFKPCYSCRQQGFIIGGGAKFPCPKCDGLGELTESCKRCEGLGAISTGG